MSEIGRDSGKKAKREGLKEGERGLRREEGCGG